MGRLAPIKSTVRFVERTFKRLPPKLETCWPAFPLKLSLNTHTIISGLVMVLTLVTVTNFIFLPHTIVLVVWKCFWAMKAILKVRRTRKINGVSKELKDSPKKRGKGVETALANESLDIIPPINNTVKKCPLF